jgi:hypothetical protein
MKKLFSVLALLILGKLSAQENLTFDRIPFGTKKTRIEQIQFDRGNTEKKKLYTSGDQRYMVFPFVGRFAGFSPPPSFVRYDFNLEDELIAGAYIWSPNQARSSSDNEFLASRIETLLSDKYGISKHFAKSELAMDDWYCEWNTPEIWILLSFDYDIRLSYFHRKLYDSYLAGLKEKSSADF